MKRDAQAAGGATQREVGDSGYPDPDTGSWLSEPPIRASEAVVDGYPTSRMAEYVDLIRRIREAEDQAARIAEISAACDNYVTAAAKEFTIGFARGNHLLMQEYDEEPEDITTGVIRAAIAIGVAFIALVLFFWLVL